MAHNSGHWAKRKKGKDAQQTLAKGGSEKRNDRIIDEFDAYRKNVWMHADSELKDLQVANVDHNLARWKIETPKHKVQATVIGYLRIKTKRLNKDKIEHPFDGCHFDMTKFKFEGKPESMIKKLFFAKSTFKSYASTLFNGINRAVRAEQHQWGVDNLGKGDEEAVPEWVQKEAADLNINDLSQWSLLKIALDELKKLCERAHGTAQKKSKPLTPSEWRKVWRQMYNGYYPEGFPNSSAPWVPSRLIKAWIIQTKSCQAGTYS